MKKIIKIFTIAMLLIILSVSLIYADTIGINSIDDLKAIKNNPKADYILNCDLDFSGISWEPFAFYGSLDGNGHSISNIKISGGFNETHEVVDANLKKYDAYLGGLFSSIEGATIKNLNLLKLKVVMDFGKEEKSAFAGSIAGYAYDSSVSDCVIDAYVFVKTAGHCFGTGGVYGFAGNCSVDRSDITVTLVCNDTDANYKDEQFMGGVYSFGYSNVRYCSVNLMGYDSDHGYVHNGGLVGCFYYYDKLHHGEISMSNNSVNGFINFFEDNKDRRAYCKAYGGEMMNWDLTMDNNTSDFGSIESKDYSTDLLPYDWEDPCVGNTDILVISSHADDEQLFFAGILPYYAQVRDLNVQVIYATDHAQSTGRILERLNGLWGVGITHFPDSLGYPDKYSETVSAALSTISRTEDEVIEDLHQMILKYQPQVIITHDVNGEYGHGMHKLMADALQKCLELHGSEYTFLKKVYLHLYEENAIVLDFLDTKYNELNGLSPFQVTQKYGFAAHKSQHDTWFYEWIYGKNNTKTSTKDLKTYQPQYFGLVYGDSALDANKNDFFEGLTSYYDQEQARLEAERKAEEARLEAERIAEEQRLLEEQKLAKRKKIVIIIVGTFLVLILALLAVRTYNINKRKARKRRAKK